MVPEGAGDIQVLIEPRKTCKKQGDPFCECYPLGSTMGQPWCAPDGCRKAWTDGCNDYTVTWPGILSEVLPHKTCVLQGVPACKDAPVTPPPPPAPALTITPGCQRWNDGCNSWTVDPKTNELLSEIAPFKTCSTLGKAKCECFPVGSQSQPWCAPDGCLKAWTDGCTDYTVTSAGTLREVLPRKTCVWQGVPACKDAPVTPPPTTPVCTGGQVFSDCMPCSKMCGGTGPGLCAMVCKSGCSCPSGAWTGSDGTCYKNKACTKPAANTASSEEQTEEASVDAEPAARGSEAVVVGAVSAAVCLVVLVVALVLYRRRRSGAAGAAPATMNELRPYSDNDL